MKNNKIIQLFNCSVIALLFTACTNHSTVIEGTLPSDKYDKQKVYWVPMEGASSKTVDSTLIHKNTFRLVVSEHNRNKMGIIRVHYLLRWGIQDILVFTEPGTVKVKLDSISSATGTPLNEVLQNWKDRKMNYDKEAYALRKKFRNASPNDTTEIKEEFKKATANYNNDIDQIIAKNKDNEIGKFIFSLHKSFYTPEQINQLKINEK